MIIRNDPVMTIARAKALLGNEALAMTDEEIQQLIDDFDILAQYCINMVQEIKIKDEDKYK